MKTRNDADPAESRQIIRQRAFELMDSGLLEGWGGVRRALHARFDTENVEQVLDSSFCRLDLDMRCQAGRSGSARGGSGMGFALEAGGIDHEAHSDRGGAPDRAASPQGRERFRRGCSVARSSRLSSLSIDIATLLADGRECTAIQIARQLDAPQRDVQRALQAMLASDDVHVARRAPRPVGGRSARIFAGGPHAPGGRDAVGGGVLCWPRADPVVIRAMDALARHV